MVKSKNIQEDLDNLELKLRELIKKEVPKKETYKGSSPAKKAPQERPSEKKKLDIPKEEIQQDPLSEQKQSEEFEESKFQGSSFNNLNSSEASLGSFGFTNNFSQNQLPQLEKQLQEVPAGSQEKKDEKLYSEVRKSYETTEGSRRDTAPRMAPVRRENFEMTTPGINPTFNPTRNFGVPQPNEMGAGQEPKLYEFKRETAIPQDLFDPNANMKMKKYQR